MTYKDALEAAGAIVHAYEEFGSYQGDWFALVTYKGKTGWVHGYFGSCEGCDAFRAEFGDFPRSHKCSGCGREDCNPIALLYDDDAPLFCEKCDICENLKKRFIRLGLEYLEDILAQEEEETIALQNIEWDLDAQEMLDFLKAHSIRKEVSYARKTQ